MILINGKLDTNAKERKYFFKRPVPSGKGQADITCTLTSITYWTSSDMVREKKIYFRNDFILKPLYSYQISILQLLVSKFRCLCYVSSDVSVFQDLLKLALIFVVLCTFESWVLPFKHLHQKPNFNAFALNYLAKQLYCQHFHLSSSFCF